MRHRAMLITMGVVLAAGLAVLVWSGLRTPSGAATGNAPGCGGDPTSPPDAAEPEYILGGAREDPDAPVKITWKGAASAVSCPELTVEPVDQVASWEDPCAEPGVIRVWELSAAESASLVQAFDEIRDLACASQDCLRVLTQSEETLEVELEAPMETQIAILIKKAASVPPSDTGETPPAVEPPEEAQADAPLVEAPVATVSFGPEQGVDFVAGVVIPEGHPLKVDLICYAGSQGLDCQAGAGPSISQQKHLKLFRTPGGTVETFGSLAQVPVGVLPAAADRDMINAAEHGWGFVLENNLSTSYTRAWIKKADATSITLQYQVFSAD